ncbi:ribosomal-processing cysteine protease Prp [Entomospira entomophila]|uniref:Ribosomal processing cysteine protease Prp n=1 Tax=Entomospira entomophila TaxID=2719988 RepID=A0A968G7S0_9SPIO|nr:ribosomal-processing cysteine protease Prp [Entomospira entomophilus]NIZ40143.1 ribosomal-processing cysteine protease Prp [Entomospira entomophilus]WDI35701.1 ribosomal-processing cysteine protease Prp [Entomospira entomophilus]
MITVSITNHKGFIQQLTISGHSVYKSSNESLSVVCLAVSLLSRTTTRFLQKVDKIHDIHIDDGFLQWQVRTLEYDPVVKTSLDMLLLGLQDLVSEWPNELVIQTHEE